MWRIANGGMALTVARPTLDQQVGILDLCALTLGKMLVFQMAPHASILNRIRTPPRLAPAIPSSMGRCLIHGGAQQAATCKWLPRPRAVFRLACTAAGAGLRSHPPGGTIRRLVTGSTGYLPPLCPGPWNWRWLTDRHPPIPGATLVQGFMRFGNTCCLAPGVPGSSDELLRI